MGRYHDATGRDQASKGPIGLDCQTGTS